MLTVLVQYTVYSRFGDSEIIDKQCVAMTLFEMVYFVVDFVFL